MAKRRSRKRDAENYKAVMKWTASILCIALGILLALGAFGVFLGVMLAGEKDSEGSQGKKNAQGDTKNRGGPFHDRFIVFGVAFPAPSFSHYIRILASSYFYALCELVHIRFSCEAG